MRILLAAALCLFSSPALADDLPQKCLELLKAGRTNEAEDIAKSLIGAPVDLAPNQIESAEKCVSSYMAGSEYIYVPSERGFRSKSDLGRRSAAEKAAAEAAEAQARTEKFLADVEQRQAERRAEVLDRLSEACTRQYRRDADAAIMNKLCFDVFMERGLPD